MPFEADSKDNSNINNNGNDEDDDDSSSFSNPGSSSLKTRLEKPSDVAKLRAGQTTPTQNEDDVNNKGSPTPVRPVLRRHIESIENGIQNGSEKDDDQDSLNDDEFESHYSRQESPASTDEEEDGDEEGNSEDEDVVEMSPTRARTDEHGGMLQRISSLPASSANTSQTTQLHMSHSMTSLPRAAPPIPPPLYPPFYNRPPTPLPPSPSLTSLLRPPSILNRSAASTRPTSPDSSDIETPATNDDTEAAVASSARRAHPLPPTSPKVPTYEYYGFVLYLASTLAFFLYIMWAYLPSPFLHAMGITYYPNRWWALALPAWIVMFLIYIYVALACWNTEYLTLGFQSVETMVDDAGNVAILDDLGRVRKGGSKRFEAEMETKSQNALLDSKRGHKKGGTATSRGSSGRHKDRRKKDKAKDNFVVWRFGYMGDAGSANGSPEVSWTQIWNEGTDAVMDVPIGGVCEVLYGQSDDSGI